MATTFGTFVLALIGLYDVGVGLYLLLSPSPWLAHGPGTSWLTLAGLSSGDAAIGLFRRMGAFSVHAGGVTIVWAAAGHRRAGARTAQFVVYLLTGLGFAWTDRAFFADTPYLAFKNGLGTLFTVAFVAHVWSVLRGGSAGAEGAHLPRGSAPPG